MNDNDDTIWLTSSITLRKLVGILGMGLPLFIFSFLYITSGHYETLESISHYYYTRSNTIFICVVSLMAIFLIIYKNKKYSADFYLSSIAGISAFLLLLFPTDSIVRCCSNLCGAYSISFIDDSSLRIIFHYICAVIFLICLNLMCLFLFTRSDKPKNKRTKQKRIRNRIYIFCGIVMTCALITVFLGLINVIPKDIYKNNHLTFWMETIAIEAFGFSWLVKGETLFRDKLIY